MDVKILLIIIAIVILQIIICLNTIGKIRRYNSIFMGNWNIIDLGFSKIGYTSKNQIFVTIAESINSYLQNNGNRASDYHLMSDIVERNTDNAEEEITSQIPTTLYIGLVGTMVGIIFGIWDLFAGEGLDRMLNFASDNTEGITSADTTQCFISVSEFNKTEGITSADTTCIKHLLSGVALAMVASAFGIICTTFMSLKMKSTKSKCGYGKNQFLSWIQANLLPKMSSDIHVALDKMSETMAQFNSQFTENTKRLNETLSLVNSTSEGQAELLETIRDLDVAQMAKANVKVYKSLQSSSEEIGNLAVMLSNSASYLQEVRNLNDKLDKSEERTKYFEEMGNYFRKETEHFDERKQYFEGKIEEIEKDYEGKINHFSGSLESKTENTMTEINEKMEEKLNEYKKFAGKQEEALKDNMTSVSKIPTKVEGLENRINSLEKSFKTSQDQIIKKVIDLTNAQNQQAVALSEEDLQRSQIMILLTSPWMWALICLIFISLGSIFSNSLFGILAFVSVFACVIINLVHNVKDKK